jgi:UDP-N-acetylglucosamine 1-carboxyvinyltransferase
VTIDARPLASTAPTERFVQRMRASFCVLGPLLARHGRARVPLPGGCRIGPRPVDLHLKGLTALGADIRVVDGLVIARAARLRGARLSLVGPHGPTVTGTANVLCAATLARGTTIVEGAAIEPEIVDLARFLNSLGARIEGLGTPTLEIRGVDQLGGARHELIADRIEAATLLAAGLITAGRVTVERIDPAHLTAVLEVFADMGADVDVAADRVTVSRYDHSGHDPSHSARLRPIDVTARPYPGVPTDMQAQLMALAAVADGTSTVADAVFGERFRHVPQLRRMGARLDSGTGVASRRTSFDSPGATAGLPSSVSLEPALVHDGGITIRGVAQLRGARVVASDLRASAALVLAALAARGTTHVERLHHLDRGYEGLEQKLRSLGATIRRESSRDLLVAAGRLN